MVALPVTEYKVEIKPTWCPGCGDYAVLTGLTRGLAALGKAPHETVVVSGIGCSSNLPHFLKCYGMHTLHGRAMAVATGIKLANPELTVIASGGDGDGYGIGVGHFIHAMRRNIDITYIVMNNEIYGLTTGQTSPTSLVGMTSKSTPLGNIEHPLNPVGLALMSGATFVARGFSGDAKHLAEVIEAGVAHKGFSLIDVQSPCVTYNKLNTYDWFRERVENLQAADHDKSNFAAAVQQAIRWPTVEPLGKVPIGIFYQAEGQPTYEDREPAYTVGNPVTAKLGLTKEQRAKLVEEFV